MAGPQSFEINFAGNLRLNVVDIEVNVLNCPSMSEKRVRVQSRCLREVGRGRFNDTSFANH